MCKPGTTEDVIVFLHARNSHTDEDLLAIKPVDKCIAPIVKALIGFFRKMIHSGDFTHDQMATSISRTSALLMDS